MQPTQWHLRVPSSNAYVDERGYTVEPPVEIDESSWWGSTLADIEKANRETLEIQRQMGYQVFPGDPGRPPEQMSHYEQCKASAPLYNKICTIL